MKPRLPQQAAKDSISRAVIYTRVSTGQQTEGTSLAGQYAACMRKAQDEGILVVSHFEEVKSGTLYMAREELQKALTIIERGEANTLILAKLDRGGRDTDDLRDVKRRVENAGARLLFADGMQFEKSAIGNLLFTQLSAFAEFEREQIRERTVAGVVRYVESGKQPASSIPPYGYYIWKKVDAIRGECSWDEVGHYIWDDAEAEWVKPIFERLANLASLRDVAAWLHEQGVPTRFGKSWNPGTLADMVHNEVYIGNPAYRKTKRHIDEGRLQYGVAIDYEEPRPREEWMPLKAPPLVDEELFRRANEAVTQSREKNLGRSQHRYLLTGLLWCPRCGHRMHSRAGRTGQIYRCSGTVRRQRATPRNCDFPSVYGLPLDALVLEAIVDLLRDPSMLQGAVQEFHTAQLSKRRTEDDTNRLRYLEKEMESLRKREQIAAEKEVEAIMKGESAEVFAAMRVQSADKRTGLEAEKEAIAERRRISQIEVPPMDVTTAERLVASFQDESIDNTEKGILLRPLVRDVYPRLVPPELRISAKVWRERGCPEPITGDGKGHPYSRYLGGCDIVLRFNDKEPCFILSRHLVGWKAVIKSKRKSLEAVWETSLKIEEKNPFPRIQIKPSNVDIRARKRGFC